MSTPQALTPAERALMQRAIPAWKEWKKLGLSMIGSLLTYQYAYKQGLDGPRLSGQQRRQPDGEQPAHAKRGLR